MKALKSKRIALSKLKVAPENVRKAPIDIQAHLQLKASIREHGLLNPLTVRLIKEGDEEAGLVVAGRNRLDALVALAGEGDLDNDAPIACSIIAAKDAVEVSLAENEIRFQMHPADACEAFAKLVAQGYTLEAVANRFGLAARLVEQRLQIARLAPDLLELYRQGGMTLDIVMVLTITTDHERQRRAWELTSDERRFNYTRPEILIRKALNEDRLSSLNHIGRLVSAQEYQKRGGHVDRDLFSNDGEVLFADPQLARELAKETLEETAVQLRAEGWKWVIVSLEPLPFQQGWSRLHPVPTAAAAALADMETRRDGLLEVEDDQWTPEHEEKLQQLDTQLDELKSQSRFTSEQRAASGCFVTAGHEGPHVEQGVLMPDDIVAIREANARAEAAEREKAETTARAAAAARADSIYSQS